ncbi:MAG: hypothetical protein HOW73_25160 [Polyangiaceae bacterium]|nr:hypothetical protein [Polyangiaceae bacterium]
MTPHDVRGSAVVLAVLAASCTSEPACPSPSPPLAVAEPPANAGALLGELADKAARAGASPLVVVAEGIASEGDRIGGFLTLPKDRCVLIYARGSKGLSDLDLFGYADDGSPLGSDESESRDAAFVLCPPIPGRVYVTARVASGAGLVAIGAQEVAPDEAPRAASAIGARTVGEDTGRLESWPGLENKIATHRRAIGSTWEDVRRFATLVDSRAATRTTVTIDPGRCLDVLVIPTEDVPSLDVVAESDNGRVIARAWPEGRDRSMLLCSEAGDDITIAARPRGGSGLAAFVVGRSPKGTISEIAEPTRIERVSQDQTAEHARSDLAKVADSSWGKAAPAGAGEARLGSRTSLDLKLMAGCTRLDVLAGKPLGPVAAALWASDGALLAESEGSARTTLYTCGAARAARIDVESRGRPGPFVVDQRTWKTLPPEISKRPAAAGRLLDRLLGAEVVAPTAMEDARAIDLEEAKLHTSSFVVAQGTCTEVFVALDAGSGIDVRLVDEVTQKDVLGRGKLVASQRICGGKTSRKARLELRVDDGPAPALVLFRTVHESVEP